MSFKGGFKNTKLGKNVYRQVKRRGPTQPIPVTHRRPRRSEKAPYQGGPTPGQRGGADESEH